jgi:hypothetical protein
MQEIVMNHTDHEYYANFESLEKLFDGDEESLKEIFSAYLLDIPKKMKGIRSDCENRWWAEAGKKVHQIKPFYGYASNRETELLLQELQNDLVNATADFDFESRLIPLESKTKRIVAMLRDRFAI